MCRAVTGTGFAYLTAIFQQRHDALLCGGKASMRIWPGRPYPLGATWDGAGVNIALFSEHATKVELCLFDSRDGTRETQRFALPEHTDLVWHGFFPDIMHG